MGVRLRARGDRVCVSVCERERPNRACKHTGYRRVRWQMCCPLWADEEKLLKTVETLGLNPICAAA